MQQGRYDQDSQEKQEQRIDDFSNPECNVAWTQGEEEHKTEEHCGKEKQCHASAASVSKHRGNPGGKGGCGTSRNGKAGANGQVEQAGEKTAVSFPYTGSKILQTVGMRIPDGGNAKDRNANCSKNKACCGRNQVPTGQLA